MAEEEIVVEKTEDEPSSNSLTKWLIFAGVVLLAFLVGFVPMWLSNRQLSSDLADRDKQLQRSRIQRSLAAATIYARRGEYETARQNTSSFFTEVRAEMDKGNEGVLTEQERIALNRVMAERDEVITLLSRNDPAAAERLSNVFVEYVGVVPNK
jgi:hypothetical protein